MFFAVEVLFLLPSNKKTKVKRRTKAKNTNSASENAIRSSYFVIESRKLMHLSRLNFVNEANYSLAWLYVLFYSGRVDSKNKIPTNHISDQRLCLLGYSKQSHRKIRLLSGWHLLCRLKINRILPTFQWISITETNWLNIFVLGKQDRDIVLVSF